MKHSIQKYTAILALAAGAMLAGAQTSTIVRDDLFAGTEKFAKGASDVTELTMDPQSLQMVGGKDAHRAHRMVLNVVHTYTYDKPGMYNIADVEEFRNKLNTGDWHCSVHTRDMKHGESTDICNKNRTDGMVETAIITVEPKELTFIHTIKQGGEGGSELVVPMGLRMGLWGSSADWAMMKADMALQMAMMKPQILEGLSGLNSGQLQMQLDTARNALNGIHLDDLHINMPNMPDLPIRLKELKRSAPSDSDMQKLKQRLDELNKNTTNGQKQPE